MKGRFKADPGAIVAASRTLAHLITEVIRKPSKNDDTELAVRKLWQLFYLDLPDAIRDEMAMDAITLERMGLNNVKSLKIGTYWFEENEFWAAIKGAVEGLTPKIKSLNVDREFSLNRLAKKDYPIIKFDAVGSSEPVQFNFDDPIIGLLHDDPEERKRMLNANRKWIDNDNATFDKTISEIITTENIVHRVRRVADLRSYSAAVFYANLESKLQKAHQFKFDDLICSSLESILHHYRIDSLLKTTDDFTVVFMKAAQTLVEEEGLELAIERLVCLPIKLPESIKNRFKELSNVTKEEMLGNFALRWAAPICKLHLIDLAMNCIDDKSFLANFSNKIIGELFNDKEGNDQYRLFKAILMWLNREFSFEAETNEWPTSCRLIVLWSHANRLHNCFTNTGAIPGKLSEIFETRDYQINSEILGRNVALWNDVLHPRRINRTGTLLLGLGNVLSDMDSQILADTINIGVVREFARKSYSEVNPMEVDAFLDPTLANNCLGSWLGRDYNSSLSFLGNETVEQLIYGKLHAIVQEAVVEAKKDPKVLVNWFFIYAIVNDLPIYKELTPKLKSLLTKVDFEDLAVTAPETALWAFRVATKQVVHLGDDRIKTKLENTLLKLATLFASHREEMGTSKERGLSLSDESIATGLIDDALSIAIMPNQSQETSRKFFSMAGKLFDIWPLTAEVFGNALFRLASELPAQQLHGIWPLILKYRATSRKE